MLQQVYIIYLMLMIASVSTSTNLEIIVTNEDMEESRFFERKRKYACSM